MRRILTLSSFILLFCAMSVLSGCAHRIDITPAVGSLNGDYSADKIMKNAGYFISEENRNLEVVTPAGGGDKVKYYPYKEMESGLSHVLGSIFTEVYALRSLQDQELVTSKKISYIFIPAITTDSASRSAWIWPPSEFWVTIDCQALDGAGKVIWQTNLKSEALLGLPQVYRDHSLAGRTAAEKALNELGGRIAKSPEFRNQ